MIRLSIKNMVCPRCIMSVRFILTSAGFDVADVALGYADLNYDSLTAEQLDKISETLQAVGFELLNDSESTLIERIKITVINLARIEGGLKVKLSAAIEDALHNSYKSLSRTFSKSENRTIENFYIAQRIEYVKELISYNELTLTDIAYKTGYSSVAHLSRQFSSVTGKTISDYRANASTRATICEV